MLMSNRILITGASGLIGIELTKTLIENPIIEELILIDPLCPPSDVLSDDKVLWLEDDLLSVNLENIVDKVDCVYHLGASTVMRWSENLEHDIQLSLMPLLKLLAALANCSPSQQPTLTFASSSAVYGPTARLKADELKGPLLPTSSYGAAKLSAEGIISSFSQSFGIKSVICRLGNVIGPSINRGLINDIKLQLLMGSDSLSLLGSGGQARTYISSKACASALIHVSSFADTPPTVFNISGHGLLTTIDVAAIFISQLRPDEDVTIKLGLDDECWVGDLPIIDLDVGKLVKSGFFPLSSKDYVVECATEI